jgi:hypothetical protein
MLVYLDDYTNHLMAIMMMMMMMVVVVMCASSHCACIMPRWTSLS